MSEVSAIDESEWAMWADFVLVHRELARELDRRLMSDAGLSQGDYTVMLTLFKAEDRRLRPGVLADAIGWEKSRLSHQLTRMAARGLVERVDCDTDARGSLVVLTNDGRRALLGAMRDHASAIRTHFLDVLTADEKAAIASGSARLLDRLRDQRDVEHMSAG
ncbi:MarR family winged helix-turn-helix transcriptional regulator [Agromyces sp. SYSU K20354]|uniref:MarR family winged helix-turn-helix transcriptional regulator n=1 Tax=Agromyces cavernae TaxID=2898659 RepID=UPI001E333351|nr:MarR family winged helix-turn-helix transcriptional regulator [Agromyces cavernae]MCD2442975.1 MarR family winged helix-turn-helix transcriptional regulator [Agromyces cavernae]